MRRLLFGFALVALALIIPLAAGANGPPPAPNVGGPIPAPAPVLLGPVTKTTGCGYAVLPDPSCTPGAYWDSLAQVGCPGGYKPWGDQLSYAARETVLAAYGRGTPALARRFVVVPLIPISMAGAFDQPNLVPMLRSTFLAKQKLDAVLIDRVCAGKMTFDAARKKLATNWVAAYRSAFHRDPPGLDGA